MGRLGRSRAFVVVDTESDIKIPSDLSGVTVAAYREVNDLRNQLTEPCTEIREAIYGLGRVYHRDQELGVLYRLLNGWTYPL